MTRCPCDTGLTYALCCGPLHSGGEAATAVALMRSRYSAFVLQDAAHLLRTWHPSTRPARLALDPDVRWTGLEVLASSAGGLLDATGEVAFRAHHGAGSQHERSRFAKVGGAWRYEDGVSLG